MLVNKKQLKSTFFWIIILIPFIPINYITTTYPITTTLYAGARYGVIIILLCRSIYKKRKLSKPIWMCIFFIIATSISSCLGGIDTYRVFSYCVIFFGMALIIDDGMRKDCIAFIRAMTILFSGLIILNFIFMIIFPNGYMIAHGVKMYLFGSYNTTLRKLMPGIYATVLYSFYKKNRICWWFIFDYALLMIFCVHVWSATSIVGLIIFIIPILIYIVFGTQLFFRYDIFFAVSILLTFIFAVLQNFKSFKLIQFVIVDILNKDMTLSSRTTVWSNTIRYIKDSPIWGYGQIDSEINRKLLGAAAAHNIFLDELYYGGIVGLILLIILVFLVGKVLNDERKKISIISVISDALFCSYFIMWNFEPFADLNSFYMMFAMFTMTYYCKTLHNSFSQEKIYLFHKTKYI